ncbi:hypothetical protein XU18_2149 [Perkinsela sp. CCAP 1560/4]|nr:hypothetical protein XU18_2149 [Perkinsela sp. CCAP 1560/4]|eukprot:KNH07104.1 hypothetical protein XU18_2149 [Perkinsela sp. CCAP 1560/4]
MTLGHLHSTDSSDEEEVDILFRFPQFESTQGTFGICEKPIEIYGLLGQPLPTSSKTLSNETQSARSNQPEPCVKTTPEQADGVKRCDSNDGNIYLRIGDFLFRGEWKDFRYIQLSGRLMNSTQAQEPLGTKVMIELPTAENNTNERFRAIPVDPDDVHTAVFQRIILTDQEIGEVRNASSDSE